MISTRWLVVLRHARLAQGRLVLMTLALAASGAALTTMLVTYSVLNREVSRNYLSTHPASVQMVLDQVDEGLAHTVAHFPSIADAEPSSVMRGRILLNNGSARSALLFVIPHLGQSRINTVRLVAGSWPRSPDGIVLERSAFGLADATLGQPIKVQVANLPPVALQVVASVHDPSLAPAWQEQTVYGYVSPEAAFALSGDANLHILKLIVESPTVTQLDIVETARAVAQRLAKSGHVVQEIRVPPPRTHPHQAQMMTLLVMLVGFSVLGLLLGSILAASIMEGFLAQRARDIALLKAVGATTGQISAQYLTLLAAVALLATGLSLPLGLWAAHGWASASAALLNLDIRSNAPPIRIILTIVAAGLLVPLGIALYAILRTSRCTVRDALGDRDISRPSTWSSVFLRLLIRTRLFSTEAAYALRNAFRRPGRVALGVALLAIAGGIFIASENLRTAWTANIAASAAQRHYEVEIDLENTESRERRGGKTGQRPVQKLIAQQSPRDKWRLDTGLRRKAMPNSRPVMIGIQFCKAVGKFTMPTLVKVST